MSDQASLGDISNSGDSEERSIKEEVPDGWKKEKLDDLLDTLISGDRPTGGGLDEGDYISVGGTQINSNGRIELDDVVYIDEDFFENVSDTQLKKHDVLMTKDGAKTGEVAIAWEERPDIVTNEHVLTMRMKEEINQPYAFYYLYSHEGWKQIHGTITGSAQEGINMGFAGKVDIKYPEKDEQRRIASVLYNVDQAISKTEEIIEQTQRVKKGLMQDLFTEGYFEHEEFEEHHTLGKYPASWEIKQVEEIGEVNPESFSADDYEEDKFDYITLSNVSEGQVLEIEETPTDEAPSRAKRRVRAGDVLIGTVRPKQRSHAKVSEEYNGNVCSTGFSVIRTKEMNSDYLSQEIFTHRFFSQMQAYVAGSGYPAVTNSDVKKMRVAVPPKEEQNKIAEVLKEHDEEIENLEMEKKQLQRLKKGLMQDLLAGEVRTGEDVGVLDAVAGVEKDE